MKTYSKVASKLMRQYGLKYSTEHVNNGEYSEHAVYVNRIANGSRPRFRVINPAKDRVKNVVKITYNPDTWDKADLADYVRHNLPLLARFSHGSCHRFINRGIVEQVLTGINYGTTKKGKEVYNKTEV